MLLLDGDLEKDDVMLDSGASFHVFNDPKWFQKLTYFTHPVKIQGATGQGNLISKGTVMLDLPSPLNTRRVLLENAYLLPTVPCNLFSTFQQGRWPRMALQNHSKNSSTRTSQP